MKKNPAKAIKINFESSVRDLHNGGTTLSHHQLADALEDTANLAHLLIPGSEARICRVFDHYKQLIHVTDTVQNLQATHATPETILSVTDKLTTRSQQIAVERLNNHYHDTLTRNSMISCLYQLVLFEHSADGIVSEDLANYLLAQCKSRVLELMHANWQYTRRSLSNVGGLLRRDYVQDISSSHTVKFLGEKDPLAARIRGHLRWDNYGRPHLRPTYSFQASNSLTEENLKRMAGKLLDVFSLKGKSGHQVIPAPSQHMAHTTVWSLQGRTGHRFEMLLYPSKYLDILQADINSATEFQSQAISSQPPIPTLPPTFH